MSSNPFAALLESPAQDDTNITSIQISENEEAIKLEKMKINRTIEDVFRFTINKNRHAQKTPLIFLEDFAEDIPEPYLNVELLGQALFERLVLDKPEKYIVPKSTNTDSELSETKVLNYLFKCYTRLSSHKCSASLASSMKKMIIQNSVLVMQQPSVFMEQDSAQQVIDIIKDIETPCEQFLTEISLNYFTDDGPSFYEAFKPVLDLVLVDAVRATLMNIDPYIYRVLDIFTNNEKYSNALLDYCTPLNPDAGLNYSLTLLGTLISVSILPKTFGMNFEYFDKPLDQSTSIVESNLWASTVALNDALHRIFLRLLLCSKSVRNRTLIWISRCLKANTTRGQLWNTHMFNPSLVNSVPDSFMINLTNLVLRLCQPICSKIKDGKILKVDPTYCAVPVEECELKGVHMYQLSTETCLVPASTDDAEESTSVTRPTAESYSFVTESFFLAHKTLDLGFRTCVDHLVQLNQDLSQIERSYNEAIQQASGTSDVMDNIKLRLEDGLTRYRSLRAVLIDPNLITLLSQFHMATATWLTQVSLQSEGHDNSSSFAPGIYKEVVFPLPDIVPDTLKCIPEFVIENTVGYLSFLRRFHPQVLEEQGYDFLDPILTMVLTFMGSPQRMRNPHLRARLAECLEALLPYHKDVPPEMNPLGRYQRESLFKEHPHRKQIVRNLLDVFVSIEMTGQSVQFEQKFNYRRPMYIVMDYLWQLEEHRDYFKELANEAESNMEAVSPPLFLRFVNLLMNDAVFLLDESLSNMAQLRTMQTARENGEWNNLSLDERTQNASYMNHIGTIARFDNILGRETIHTLQLLTSEITIVFTHATMVDRVAAMLNYFLFNLVGPNKKNFKVKDQKDYEFKPANTVLNICRIYIHLYESDSFCLAVSQDGRSYSPQLFTLAEDILARIGGGSLISELQQVASKVAKLASLQEAEEEVLAEAPEEFLDPIMSTLMSDPVVLPSSKQIVDRTTIARHLLSDQTDPFNRSPLTMDQVIPDTDLSNRIKTWILERRKEWNVNK